MSTPDTPSLLRRIAFTGCDRMWTIFVERYSPLVLAQCRSLRLQEADAEEIRSRVMERLITALRDPNNEKDGRFRGYLHVVTRRVIIDCAKERRRPGAMGSGDQEFILDVAAFEQMGAMIDEEIHARLSIMERAIERVQKDVDADTWRAYWLTAIEGRKGVDVAKEMGKSVGAVYMARNRVAQRLAKAGEDLMCPEDSA